MAITKEYNLKIDTATAQANVDELNESFELQKDLVGDIEKELRDYEKQLRNTSEKNLSARKRLNDKIKQTKKVERNYCRNSGFIILSSLHPYSSISRFEKRFALAIWISVRG